jgi:hypothetical protein
MYQVSLAVKKWDCRLTDPGVIAIVKAVPE